MTGIENKSITCWYKQLLIDDKIRTVNNELEKKNIKYIYLFLFVKLLMNWFYYNKLVQ